jgi:aspartate carbamoyltransferase regulatory subunit
MQNSEQIIIYKCPYCNEEISYLNIQRSATELGIFYLPKPTETKSYDWDGIEGDLDDAITYLCPECDETTEINELIKITQNLTLPQEQITESNEESLKISSPKLPDDYIERKQIFYRKIYIDDSSVISYTCNSCKLQNIISQENIYQYKTHKKYKVTNKYTTKCDYCKKKHKEHTLKIIIY